MCFYFINKGFSDEQTFFADEMKLFDDEFFVSCKTMSKMRAGWLIHIFALLHLFTAIVCKAYGLSDTLLLTMLTMTLTVLLCSRERLSLEFTALAIVLVNVVGYFAGVGLAALFDFISADATLRAGLATFLTTELIGWVLMLVARSRVASLGRGTGLIVEDKQMTVLIIAIAIIYVARVLLDLYSSGEGSRGEIIGNSIALLLFVADVIFIARSVRDAQTHPIYKERFLVRVGDKIIPRQTSEIACVISENKGTYIICKDGSRYAVNPSLDELSGSLDPLMFFRISRSAIISKTEVLGAERQPSGKLTLETKLPAPLEVSRARVDDFLSWLEN
jgi:hypothetical protein